MRQRQGANQRQKVTERDTETEQGKMETEAEVTTVEGGVGELDGGTGKEGHGERDPQGGGRGTTERVERK